MGGWASPLPMPRYRGRRGGPASVAPGYWVCVCGFVVPFARVLDMPFFAAIWRP